MAKDTLFKRLCTHTSIEIGWHLAHSDSRDDFATDPLGYADYAFMKKERFRFIVEQIRDHRYRFSRLTDIDIPKSGLSVRPGNVLPIEEATVLHAITYLIAPRIDPKLLNGVYSYRLKKEWQKNLRRATSLFSHGDVSNIPFLKRKTISSIDIEEPWYVAWPEFDAASVKAVKEYGFTHLTKTDITAYFENIELSILGSLLRRYLPADPAIVEILTRMLNYWTRHTPSGIPIGRGIPQGNNVSSFLGNIYLMPLDDELERFCRRKDAMWFRYVDDVKLFTKNYDDAREAVFLISKVLRHLHLNLQGSKTEILTGRALELELFDPELEIVNTQIAKLEKLKGKTSSKQITKVIRATSLVAKQFTRGLPNSVSKFSNRQSRLFRRCLTFYGMAGRPQLRRTALAALRHLPELRILRSSLNYLVRLDQKYHQGIVTELLDMIENKDLPFSYQVALTIEHFKYLSPKEPKRLASVLRQLGYDKNTDWYVRQKTLETITVLPYREVSAESLAVRSIDDESPWVRRAGAVLTVRGTVGWVRRRVDILVYHADPDVARVGLFLKRHLEDKRSIDGAFAGLVNNSNDRNFLRRLPIVYILRCHREREVGRRLRSFLESYKSKNSLIVWHRRSLLKQLDKWVDEQNLDLPFA